MAETSIIIYTDGGCHGNPGPGAWAYVMRYDERYTEASGAELATTNNRMELTAVIKALSFIKERIAQAKRSAIEHNIAFPQWIYAPIVVFTDSQYVKKGITEWIANWKARSWKTSGKKPVLNKDLWEQLDTLVSELQPSFEWVEGHAGNVDNERCDQLVQEAIQSLIAS